jgi:hypothetical protein
LGLIFCIQIPFVHGIQYSVSLFIFSLVGFSTVTFAIKDYPFSVKREIGDKTQRFSFLFFVVPFLGLTLFIQRIIHRNNLIWYLVHGGLLILFCGLEFLSSQRLDRILEHKESSV